MKVKHVVGIWYSVCCDDEDCIGHEQSRLYTLRRLAAKAWNRRANECDRDELIDIADELESFAEQEYCACGIEEPTCNKISYFADRIRKALVVE